MAEQTKEKVKKNLDEVLGGNVTQGELDAWKLKHGEVHIIKVIVDANVTLTGYFKKPDRPILANCVNLSAVGQLFEAKEFLWANSWLGGDAAIKTNQDAALAGQQKLWGMFSFLKAEGTKY